MKASEVTEGIQGAASLTIVSLLKSTQGKGYLSEDLILDHSYLVVRAVPSNSLISILVLEFDDWIVLRLALALKAVVVLLFVRNAK